MPAKKYFSEAERREARAKRVRARYYKLKKLKICVHCKKKSALEGKVRCGDCSKIWSSPKYLARERARSRERYYRGRKLNICPRCNIRETKNFICCLQCRQKENQRKKDARNRKCGTDIRQVEASPQKEE